MGNYLINQTLMIKALFWVLIFNGNHYKAGINPLQFLSGSIRSPLAPCLFSHIDGVEDVFLKGSLASGEDHCMFGANCNQCTFWETQGLHCHIMITQCLEALVQSPPTWPVDAYACKVTDQVVKFVTYRFTLNNVTYWFSRLWLGLWLHHMHLQELALSSRALIFTQGIPNTTVLGAYYKHLKRVALGGDGGLTALSPLYLVWAGPELRPRLFTSEYLAQPCGPSVLRLPRSILAPRCRPCLRHHPGLR